LFFADRLFTQKPAAESAASSFLFCRLRWPSF
jgi:hypothetical protein